MKRALMVSGAVLTLLLGLVVSPGYSHRPPGWEPPEGPAGIRGRVAPEWSAVEGRKTAAQAAGSAVKTVRVDCDKGESVNEALAKSEQELVIEISGMCQEIVVVDRGNVTLRGTDPSHDGIRGGGSHPKYWAVVNLSHANFVRFENLTLAVSGDELYGVFVVGSDTVDFDNCQFEGSWPLTSSYSFLRIVDSSFVSEADGIGIDLWQASYLQCTGCSLSSYRWGIVTRNSRADIRDSLIQGTNGVLSFGGGARTVIINSTVSATGAALYAANIANFEHFGGTVTGSVYAEWGGRVWLEDVEQTEAADNGAFDGTLALRGGTRLLGHVWGAGFGKVLVHQDAAIEGDLFCWEAGDAFCADPAKISGGSSGCESCVAP